MREKNDYKYIEKKYRNTRTTAECAYLPHPIIRIFFCIFVATIPFEILDIGGSGYFSLSKLAGIIFAIVAVIFAHEKVLSKPPKAFWLFLWYVVLLVLVGLAYGGFLHEMVRRFIQLTQMLILLAFGFQFLQNSKFAKLVFLTFAFSAFALVSLELVGRQYLKVLSWGSVERVGVLDWSLNALGGVLAVAGVAFIGVAFGGQKRITIRTWFLISLTLIPLTLALARTGSRTGMLALILGAVVLFLRRSRTLAGKVRVLAMGSVIVLILLVIMAHNETANVRWTATFERNDLAKRQDIFSASLEVFRARPIFGWGPGRNVYVIGAKIHRNYVDTHNSLLWILTETGILGAIPFLLGILLCLRSAWRARKGPNGILPLALLIATLVVNSSTTAINMKYTWLVFAFALASDPTLTSKLRGALPGRRRPHTPVHQNFPKQQ